MKRKKKYSVYAVYTCTKFIGEFEAMSKSQAEDLADDSGDVSETCNVCHQCTDECGGDRPQFHEFYVEESK